MLGPFQVRPCALTLPLEDAQPPAEPVVWWKLDEQPGRVVTDVAGTQGNGQIRGPVRWAASRNSPTGALEFDGKKTWVERPDSSPLDFPAGLTVSTWFKVRRFADGQPTLIAKGDAWRIVRQSGKGGLQFETDGLQSTDKAVKSTTLTTKGPVDDDHWHHVLAVCDGKRLALYLDGVEQSSVPVSGVLACNNLPVTLGDNAAHPGQFFDGWLDEVRVYGRGLSAKEITALHQAEAR